VPFSLPGGPTRKCEVVPREGVAASVAMLNIPAIKSKRSKHFRGLGRRFAKVRNIVFPVLADTRATPSIPHFQRVDDSLRTFPHFTRWTIWWTASPPPLLRH